VEDLWKCVDASRALEGCRCKDPSCSQAHERLRTTHEEADLEFLQGELPSAFDRTFDGIHRVSEIVKAMRRFSRADASEMSPCDINQAVEDTLVVARSEYKMVADVQTELAQVPEVVCHVNDINQVLLNLVVNAAHAIAARPDGGRGTIRMRTAVDDDHVVVEVVDDGIGIPEEVRARIFDPFFTTKEVGKGTGQGLAIARGIVVDKHGGTLSCQSTPGAGTNFTVRLPIERSKEPSK
jgi:signal transduction histidine kinase